MRISRTAPIVLPLFTILALALSACGGPGTSMAPDRKTAAQTERVAVPGSGSYTNVNVAGMVDMLENKDFPFINVHIPYEGEIEGTDLFIPYDKIEQHLDQLPANKNARVVLYCRSGRMSEEAASTLVQLGYTDVWNLDGGMIAWKQAGYPILEKDQ